MTFEIKEATAEDAASMLPHFPRLADFTLPANREAHHFWKMDEAALKAWAKGEEALLVQKAVDETGTLLGFTMTRLREEFLSHEPSAHLEVLIVVEGAEGKGVGGALLKAAEKNAQKHGALSMSLHVIGTNTRARRLYQQLGYTEEIIRNIKHF